MTECALERVYRLLAGSRALTEDPFRSIRTRNLTDRILPWGAHHKDYQGCSSQQRRSMRSLFLVRQAKSPPMRGRKPTEKVEIQQTKTKKSGPGERGADYFAMILHRPRVSYVSEFSVHSAARGRTSSLLLHPIYVCLSTYVSFNRYL